MRNCFTVKVVRSCRRFKIMTYSSICIPDQLIIISVMHFLNLLHPVTCSGNRWCQ